MSDLADGVCMGGIMACRAVAVGFLLVRDLFTSFLTIALTSVCGITGFLCGYYATKSSDFGGDGGMGGMGDDGPHGGHAGSP